MSLIRSILLLRRALPLAFVILSFGVHHSATAHPADQSEMRARPKPHQLELRFTFNILTLTRFVGIDTDGDGKISMAELTAAQPRIATYLNQHVRIEVNQKKATLGSGVKFDALWPEPEKTAPMAEPEYAARNVDVTFIQTFPDKLLEDFWLGFEIFEQTGPMQTIRGVYDQDGRIEEVPFSVQEPEYLYDTGFAEDPFVQEAEKKAAKPAAKDSAATATGASIYRKPVEVVPVPEQTETEPQLQPPAAQLATTLNGTGNAASNLTAASTEPPNDNRWWMIRAGVLIVLLVVGRTLQLKARSRLVSTRRRPRSRSR